MDGNWYMVSWDSYQKLYTPEGIHREPLNTPDEDVLWSVIIMGDPDKNERKMLLRNRRKTDNLRLRYICEFAYGKKKKGFSCVGGPGIRVTFD